MHTYYKLFYKILMLLPLLAACAAEEPKPEDPIAPAKPTITHYTLSVSDTVDHEEPLPLQRKVFITWHYSDESKETEHAYNLWDYDRDGVVDRAEKIQ